MKTNKKKIINDPVHGFIQINSEILFDLIEHPYFQRLRRIKQLGLTTLVYPGANHTRFQHAIGAMHLVQSAIHVLRQKDCRISNEEAQACSIAILLHDIGHGPFSHALEHSVVSGIDHEEISLMYMQELNKEFDGKLDLAIEIFQNKYHKNFLHQLVSSQLDMDRMDYLLRDSFFTGVTEGKVSSERIIKMLRVENDELVVESKGIYSIEKFLIARRLMYWQVYLHKTVISAENLLVQILRRAKDLSKQGFDLFATPALSYFLNFNYSLKDLTSNSKIYKSFLEQFSQLDDNDISVSAKVWANSNDPILAKLCQAFVHRKLFRVEFSQEAFPQAKIENIKKKCKKDFNLKEEDLKYFVFSNSILNSAYHFGIDQIKIAYNNGKLLDISEASVMLNTSVLSQEDRKYFLFHPKLSEL